METIQETPKLYFDQHVRDRHDAETWLAEVLDGRMVTKFSYNYDPQANELYAEDGSSLKEIFDTAIVDAERLAAEKPNLVFELRRRHLEKAEHDEMLAMMQGDKNTMIVVSDFPPELMDAHEDVGGYNVVRKQTMLRVITKDDEETITVKSLSLDGSNREALEEIYAYFGRSTEAGELLGQRIHTELDTYQQEFLADALVCAYDQNMQRQFGGTWKAGRRQPDNHVNTYDFVQAQQDLLDYYLQQKNSYLLDQESLQFAIAAEMERRWLNSNEKVSLEGFSANDAALRLEQQIWLSAQVARAEGKVYSGCGASIGALDSQNELDTLGYGNKSDEKSTYSFNKKQHCVVCQPQPKDNEPKKMCGPCGICKSCDAKL